MTDVQTRYKAAATALKAAEQHCKNLATLVGEAERDLSRARDRLGNLKSQQYQAGADAGKARDLANVLGQELLAEVAAEPEPQQVRDDLGNVALPGVDFDDDIPF
jgi:predicted  nucleic acid-binding Zn-ribbon protein